MTYTLVADGTSNAVLVPILTWSLKSHGVTPIFPQVADRYRIPRPPSRETYIQAVLDLYPCDVLFIHRDAERQTLEERRTEIAAALQGLAVRHIPVVPVRMTEAWLLADEAAIRSAAGNPNGREELNLPTLRRLEDVADPKQVLYAALRSACGLNQRRRAALAVQERVHRISNYITDYSSLRVLQSFRVLQQDISTSLV